jgi:hypothetical protein
MKKHFNLSRYKELLKLRENAKISFSDENFFELVSYRASIEKQVSYNREKCYCLVIDKYLSRVISLYEFRLKFLKMEKEVFTFAEDLEKFSDFMGRISTLCFEYDEL